MFFQVKWQKLCIRFFPSTKIRIFCSTTLGIRIFLQVKWSVPKACGHDKIAFEHLKYGGRLLLRHLHHLFNMCLQCGYVPSECKRGIIILLFKGGNKSRTDTNSYRGISLVPSIAKVFEKLIYIELSKLSNLQAQSSNSSITSIEFV